MDAFSDAGYWWLPGHNSEPTPGVIHFEHGNLIRVELNGDLNGAAGLECPILFGDLRGGEHITLTRCRRTESRRERLIGKTLSQTLVADRIFRGAHLAGGIRTVCNVLSLEFEHLSEWALPEEPFINSQTEWVDDWPVRETRTYTFPPPIEFPFLEGTLKVTYHSSFESATFNDETVVRRVELVYLPSSPVRLEDLDDPVIESLQQFFTLACATPVHPTSITFTSPSEIANFLGSNETHQPRIEYAWSNWHAPTSTIQPSWSMLLPLRAIQAKIATHFIRWQELRTAAKSALDLFFASELGPPVYLETHFLFVAQSLEVYHRRRLSKDQDQQQERKVRLDEIQNHLSGNPELAAWAEANLRGPKELSYRDRMYALIEYAGPHARDLCPDNFPKLMADTRNYHTHFDRKQEKHAAGKEELYWLTQQATALGWYCFLRDLDLDSDESWDRLTQTQEVRAVLRFKAP